MQRAGLEERNSEGWQPARPSSTGTMDTVTANVGVREPQSSLLRGCLQWQWSESGSESSLWGQVPGLPATGTLCHSCHSAVRRWHRPGTRRPRRAPGRPGSLRLPRRRRRRAAGVPGKVQPGHLRQAGPGLPVCQCKECLSAGGGGFALPVTVTS